MSEAAREAALEHFGVPGMKWGVRKNRSGPSDRQLNRALKPANKASEKAAIATTRAHLTGKKSHVRRAETKIARAKITNAQAQARVVELENRAAARTGVKTAMKTTGKIALVVSGQIATSAVLALTGTVVAANLIDNHYGISDYLNEQNATLAKNGQSA